MRRRASWLGLVWLTVVSALPGMAGIARADEPGCPRPAGVPEGARYSCPTRTQTWQPGETVTRHPGGAPGRGTGQPSPGPSGSNGQLPGTSLYCQVEQDGLCHCGPRQGTGRNIPCRPSGPDQYTSSAVRRVFNYYYLNGINTPLKGRGRGNYRWDWQMIKANLLDQATPVGQVPQRGPGYATRIHVADEIDLLSGETHNLSGRDPVVRDAADDFCKSAQATLGPGFAAASDMLCGSTRGVASWLDDARSGKTFRTMALGDIAECLLQATGADIGWGLGASGINHSAKLPEVQDVVRRITEIYDSEKRSQQSGTREINYFIVIGHSQGNFFAEGVAYALQHQAGSGAAVFEKRFGVIALASPTSYDSLPGSFVQSRLKHVTRMDDAILALDAADVWVHAKRPFPGNAAPLWPWPSGGLLEMKHALDLGAPPACACDDPDDALYIPRMNSHLIDNYLTDPPLTEPGRAINAEAAQKMSQRASLSARGLSPQTTPVLAKVRLGLFELKRELLTGW